MFGWLFGKGKEAPKSPQEAREAISHTLSSQGRKLGKQLGETSFRYGMWVVYEGRIGILTKQAPSSPGDFKVEIDVVDPATGDTQFPIVAPLAGVRQAQHHEIPELRRPHESVSLAKGYLK